MQYMGLYVFSLPIYLLMVVRIFALNLIIIITSEIWISGHCLGLGHKTMVCVVHHALFLCCSWVIWNNHDDVIKWKHFPRYWPFVRGIHRSPVNSPHKGQWRGALMFSLICVWINGWVNNREAGDLRRYRAHYSVIVMTLAEDSHH